MRSVQITVWDPLKVVFTENGSPGEIKEGQRFLVRVNYPATRLIPNLFTSPPGHQSHAEPRQRVDDSRSGRGGVSRCEAHFEVDEYQVTEVLDDDYVCCLFFMICEAVFLRVVSNLLMYLDPLPINGT